MVKLEERSRICQGLMRINNLNNQEVDELIKFDLENGINFFDTADIYDNGGSETKLGIFIKNNPELREKMFIQTKCGIFETQQSKNTIYHMNILLNAVKIL